MKGVRTRMGRTAVGNRISSTNYTKPAVRTAANIWFSNTQTRKLEEHSVLVITGLSKWR